MILTVDQVNVTFVKKLEHFQCQQSTTSPINIGSGFINFNDLKVFIKLFQGFYKGGRFVFSFKVGPNYPHEPPKVKCETQVYHPNIDLDGNVCLNILREDWKPVLTINSIVYGLQYLFLVCLILLPFSISFLICDALYMKAILL